MAPTEMKRSRSAPATGPAIDWNLGRISRVALAMIALFWGLSQFDRSPIDLPPGAATGEGGGLSPSDYNEQQWRNDVFDDINGCPYLDDCAGLDPDPLDQLPGY